MEAQMYLNTKVKIPSDRPGITRKTIKGTTYIYYTYSRTYDPDKKYTRPVSTSIGKWLPDEPDMMIPNNNFQRFFPEIELEEDHPDDNRSSCLRIGAYLVLQHIIREYHLDEMLENIIGKDSGFFLDLACYSIITENNAGQYYPDYAFNHPLFTNNMKIYSDSSVSEFLNTLGRETSIAFQNEWNANHDHRERIYISYDSTNKNCQAGDLDFVEFGHAKHDTGAPVVNYSIAYDTANSVPLFYEDYPGSIVDVSQLQYMIEKANGYGYRHVGFILDRGYFSEANIHYMDKSGYEFVIMMKGMKQLVKDLVLEVKGSFEEHREHSIRKHKVSGITVKRRLYASDKKERYFHIYYDDRKRSTEHEAIEDRIDKLTEALRKVEGKPFHPTGGIKKYFDLVYSNPGTPEERFAVAREKHDVINEEIRLCGYFVIITSEKMNAETALDLYKGRDVSEKLFRGDKSYLGNRSFRIHTSESMHAKIFVEFVALIIRSRFHTCLKEQTARIGKRYNFMNVAAAVRELEKIELIRRANGDYLLDHAVTATQKTILKSFGMDASAIRSKAAEINAKLQAIARKEIH